MTKRSTAFKQPADLPPEVFDPARLAAVRATGLLDTGPDEVFDEFARLAAAVTGAQRAFVTVVDDRRSYWKSVIGAGELSIAERQNCAEDSACHVVVATDAPVIAEDAARDPRLAGIGGIVQMGVGAWAGYPIHAPGGEVLGTLCVVDSEPRAWTALHVETLAALSRAITAEIRLRDALNRSERQMVALRASAEVSAELARTLQESLLPPLLLSPPGLQAAAAYVPAESGVSVLGDFYDLFAASGSRWCALLGDVSGHGVEAAKITALARYTVRADAPHHNSPSLVLAQLNAALLAQRTSGGQFLTAICAIFRPDHDGVTGLLCTAGHPSALIRRRDGSVQEVRSNGALLGLFDDPGLSSVRFTLLAGDTLLLYTDGITEAPAPGGELFGEERLRLLLSGCERMNASAVVARIRDAVLAHGGPEPRDDVALLALRVPLPEEFDPAGTP
ncbi:PP2C family protein-serine/threonine phosphatase [Streptosporangium lutulentum]|uniref:Serine phosphatase RsbU (Regulator of sigma subunit) n=1 Tax=Streptosporangium lutulentum TaxID=1461250 RepID=A0ABT9Q6D0_9ACTN|nr:GAF domain-containing SpoIIE family protein phosphatase [Streptosporangium lutulentum]MDP9842310.1 serine phosphatase RsbU (regulator of sigma subunit) [Streptosporangium lutulentum]